MNKKKTQQQERGQSLVLVALAMVGLLAFAGLALDGGLAYATRRVAQNAADSGAIAGTFELHRQQTLPGFNASLLDQELILSRIHEAVESHDVPDTDGIPGNHINKNVHAFYVSQGTGGGVCSNTVGTDFEELCEIDPDNPCNATDVKDKAVGISIEVDVPFEPMFSAVIYTEAITISNQSSSFDHRTAAIVNAKDTGYNSDLWAIFAMSNGSASGPSTFIEVDPAFQPPTGLASANVHSQGSFSVATDFPIWGQVTYCVDCSNCFKALYLPEQKQNTIELPDFTYFADLARERAEEAGQVESGPTTWGLAYPNTEFKLDPSPFYFIDGDLTIDEGFLVAGANLFIYVNGDVTINGFFTAQDLSILAEGTITVNGTLRNTGGPYPTSINDPDFNANVAVLWSKIENDSDEVYVINITGEYINESPFFSENNSDIRGAVIAPSATVNVNSKNIHTIVRGSVIGNNVFINSDPDTGAQTRIQYNGNYFPASPDRIELLK